MITTKYNFKLWLHRKYPDITATPIYGMPAYILSKPLNPADNFLYNVQQLPDSRHVVFIGVSIHELKDYLNTLRVSGIPQTNYRAVRTTAPTTFASFQAWLNRNHIVPLNRTFCSNDSVSNLFKDPTQSMEKRAWYMYELPITGERTINNNDTETLFKEIPHIYSTSSTDEGLTVNVVIVLIKASTSIYKSKKQRFIEKFDLMQPLYEKLIADCAKAQFVEESGERADDEWNIAMATCNQYMGILFEREGYVEISALREAAHEGSLGLFTRNPENFVSHEGDPASF